MTLVLQVLSATLETSFSQPYTLFFAQQGSLDFERKRQYDIEVVAADNGGNSGNGLRSSAKVSRGDSMIRVNWQISPTHW